MRAYPVNGSAGISSLPTHSRGLTLVGLIVFSFAFNSSRSQPKSESGISFDIPCISALNLLNIAACRGFVKWSAIISVAGQCFRVMSPDVILSFIKNYLTRICLVRLLLDSRSIALRLSRLRIDSSIFIPCSSMKYHVNSICGAASSTPTSSASFELLVLIFCFFDIPIIEPRPRDIVPSVWPRQSL
jgi:hypothetical protein